MSRGRKRRKAAAAHSSGGVAVSPAPWVPDLANAHLQSAAAGRLSIGDPFHHAPPPITFPAPGAAS